MSIDIANLRKLLGAATPGPWHREWADSHPDPANIEILAVSRADRVALIEEPDDASEVADADLIVALRNAAPELLDEVERLRAYRDRTEAALRKLCGGVGSMHVAISDALDDLGLWRDAKETP